MSGWQDIAALVLVALAVAHIVWRAARKLVKRGDARCGGCASCEAPDENAQPRQLVSLQPPPSGKR